MKKDKSNRTSPQLPSEQTISEISAHERLAHEDKDPIYPFEPIQGQKSKGLKNDQSPKHKKRKAG